MPYAGQRVAGDGILIPTGDILANEPGSLNDFWSAPKQLGANFSNPDLLGNCGTNCTGYGTSLSPFILFFGHGDRDAYQHEESEGLTWNTDTCYITDRDAPFDWQAEGVPPVARLRSDWSGIQVDIYTDQDAFQVYSCGGQNGSVALKKTQGLFDVADRPRTIQQYGCIVMEVEDWIDAINQPEWERSDKQIFSPGGAPYVLQASYVFSLNDTKVGLLGPGSG